ncbi:MAG TPA: glycerol-3-phosphate 1-O-acyltransferase PlsY [Chthoniobacteraceae bacterium]|jgi:glycerol-3-phosphate acyltransferase PlsY|nr:Glycerol-3-phosphate acyltransferase [Chthoniobacter sp.]HEV7867792.1 glycerol-3-phosphate 1-O-acyltransferase PlsY [Chthoniobacteraceae bacterium]
MPLLIAAIVVLAYLLGSIPFGLIFARSKGVDLRAHGSGNIGATNVWRVMGKKWGLITFFADAAKGWLAVVLALWLARHWDIHVPLPHGHEKIEHLDEGFAGIAGALGCILGHNFPVWLRFKGGKGVATSLGVIIGMMPLASVIIFAIWGLVFKTSRYVSLASLIAAVSLPIVVIGLMLFWPVSWWGAVTSWGHFYFAVAAAGLVLKRHSSNIKRLVAGTELRFGSKDAPAPAVSPDESEKAP